MNENNLILAFIMLQQTMLEGGFVEPHKPLKSITTINRERASRGLLKIDDDDKGLISIYKFLGVLTNKAFSQNKFNAKVDKVVTATKKLDEEKIGSPLYLNPVVGLIATVETLQGIKNPEAIAIVLKSERLLEVLRISHSDLYRTSVRVANNWIRELNGSPQLNYQKIFKGLNGNI